MISVAFILTASIMTSTEQVSFIGPNGWEFQAKIHIPEELEGHAVLMIGGGIGNSLNWTTPETLLLGNVETQITISGKSHDDASIISDALVSKGCITMHYSTVSLDDPKCDLYPYELGLTDPQSVMEIARAAYKTFKQHPAVQECSHVVLGFSMGAQRAVQLAKENYEITCLVLLSGAQMTATSKADFGGNVHKQASKLINDQELEMYDFDHDGVVHEWEVSGVLAINARNESGIEALPTIDRFGMPFGEPILELLKKPTLALYGSLDDSQSYHAVILSQDLSNRKWLDVRVIPQVGHQLGPEKNGRFAPISKSVCVSIAKWISTQ